MDHFQSLMQKTSLSSPTLLGLRSISYIQASAALVEKLMISWKVFSLQLLCPMLEEHFQPKPNVIAQCFTFYQRNQKPTESIAEYLAALRKLAIDCNFGAKEVLEATLEDPSCWWNQKYRSTKAKAIGNAHASKKARNYARNIKSLNQQYPPHHTHVHISSVSSTYGKSFFLAG